MTQILTITARRLIFTVFFLTYCILRVEDVRGRRVVYNDDFPELPAQSTEVFHVVSSVENAGFPEEPGAEHPPLVQQVCHRIGILVGAKIWGLAVSASREATLAGHGVWG